jgi:hypothetical protein
LANVGRERKTVGKTSADVIAEIHDEDFVLSIACANERERCQDYISVFRAHTAAGIDDQANRNRDVIAGKVGYRLKLPAFINPEVIFPQVRDAFARRVFDADIQKHEFGGSRKMERLRGRLNRGRLRRECSRG